MSPLLPMRIEPKLEITDSISLTSNRSFIFVFHSIFEYLESNCSGNDMICDF